MIRELKVEEEAFERLFLLFVLIKSILAAGNNKV
jgi:hypothetical protein